LQYSTEPLAFDFNIKSDNDYNPLKLRHGFGFDKQENDQNPLENEHAIEARKINKMPFKVLDAP
jgi:hypothetical protein